jgi:site-specific DNA-methyltransferase (adenine-specific)
MMNTVLIGGLAVENKLYQGDCLKIMPTLTSQSVDLILCDLPYGTTACKWDVVIPFSLLWEEYLRIAKSKAAIVLTSSQPFTAALVMSKPELFRHEWVWRKERPTNFMLGKTAPMKYHENIVVFSKEAANYNPQLEPKPKENKRNNRPRTALVEASYGQKGSEYDDRVVVGGVKDWNYPSTIQYFSMQRGLHPTQKPVALMEYLIKTYTNEGDTVLDNCMGSGTTGVACVNTGRNFIGIEKDPTYFEICKQRIAGAEVVEWAPQPPGEMCLSHNEENCKRCNP